MTKHERLMLSRHLMRAASHYDNVRSTVLGELEANSVDMGAVREKRPTSAQVNATGRVADNLRQQALEARTFAARLRGGEI